MAGKRLHSFSLFDKFQYEKHMVFLKHTGLGFLLLILSSCEEPFDPQFYEEEGQLVVVSNFNPNSPIEVYVSVSQSVVEEAQTAYLSNAEVDVLHGDTLLVTLALATKMDGDRIIPYYTHPNFVPKEGRWYTLRVRAEGYAPVSATSYIPPQVKLDSINLENLATETPEAPSNEEETQVYTYDINLQFLDPAGENNYYHLNVYQQVKKQVSQGDTTATELLTYKIFFSPALNTNHVTVHHDGGILLEDTPFDGTYARLSFPVRFVLDLGQREELGDLLVEFRSVSREYFLFHTSLSKQKEQGKDPLHEPVLVYDNIQNGHGIFAGFNSSQDSVVIGN